METRDILRQVLFADDGEKSYAVIDGAACEELLDRLIEHEPDSCCLAPGELTPDMEVCAPYLIALKDGKPFTEWLLSNLPGKPWGILARSPATLRQLRKHFRAFLTVKNEQGENLYFRYYDPRVIRIFLPTCDAEQFDAFFAPVTAYVAEAHEGHFVCYQFKDSKLDARQLNPESLPAAQPN